MKTTTWRDRGLHRNQYGTCRRNKIKTGTFGCNSIQGAMDIQQVEIYNSKVKTDNFNLDEMSTQAILAFVNLNTGDRDKVLKILKKNIISDTHPITGKPLGVKGITERMVYQVIELATTGKVTPRSYGKQHSLFYLTEDELDTLDIMKEYAIDSCDSPQTVIDIMELVDRIKENC